MDGPLTVTASLMFYGHPHFNYGLNVPFLTIINFVCCLRVCVYRATANDDRAVDDGAPDHSQFRTSTERQQRQRFHWYDQ